MTAKYTEVQSDLHAGRGACDPKDWSTIDSAANGNRDNDETRVRKYDTPPGKMKGGPSDLKGDSQSRYTKEEKGQRPETDRNEDRQNFEDLRSGDLGSTDNKSMRKDFDCGIGHANICQSGERRWANAYKHTWPSTWRWKTIRHEPSKVVTEHEDRDHQAQSLEGGSSYDDWNGLFMGLRACN